MTPLSASAEISEEIVLDQNTTVPGYASSPDPWCETLDRWPFQELKMGGTYPIYKAYLSGLCKGISPENMALYGTVPPF